MRLHVLSVCVIKNSCSVEKKTSPNHYERVCLTPHLCPQVCVWVLSSSFVLHFPIVYPSLNNPACLAVKDSLRCVLASETGHKILCYPQALKGQSCNQLLSQQLWNTVHVHTWAIHMTLKKRIPPQTRPTWHCKSRENILDFGWNMTLVSWDLPFYEDVNMDNIYGYIDNPNCLKSCNCLRHFFLLGCTVFTCLSINRQSRQCMLS